MTPGSWPCDLPQVLALLAWVVPSGPCQAGVSLWLAYMYPTEPVLCWGEVLNLAVPQLQAQASHSAGTWFLVWRLLVQQLGEDLPRPPTSPPYL